MSTIRIALIGDFDPTAKAHQAIPVALRLAAEALQRVVEGIWIVTDSIQTDPAEQLADFAAIWCVPKSPYRSMNGALTAIRFARETGRPFLGTCGGFQHAVLEYARNVLGLYSADHMESNPEAEIPLITPLACSL